jgi:hypothetical protein
MKSHETALKEMMPRNIVQAFIGTIFEATSTMNFNKMPSAKTILL